MNSEPIISAVNKPLSMGGITSKTARKVNRPNQKAGKSSNGSGSSQQHARKANKPNRKAGKTKDLSSIKCSLLPISSEISSHPPANDYNWEYDDHGDPIRKVFEYFELMTIREEDVEIVRHARLDYLKKLPRLHKFFERNWSSIMYNTPNIDEADIIYGSHSEDRACIYLQSLTSKEPNEQERCRQFSEKRDDAEYILLNGPNYTMIFQCYTGNPKMPRATTFYTARDCEWKDLDIRLVFDNGAGLPPDQGDNSVLAGDSVENQVLQLDVQVEQAAQSDNMSETPESAQADQGPAANAAEPIPAVVEIAENGGMEPQNDNVHLDIPLLSNIFPGLYISYHGSLPSWAAWSPWIIRLLLFLLSWLKIVGISISIYSTLRLFHKVYTTAFSGPYTLRRFMPFRTNDFLFRWLYWSRTGYYEMEDPTPANVFLDTRGNPDEAAHARYIASMVDATKTDTPDLTNIIRSYSANPKRPGTNFVNVVCDDFTNAHILSVKMQAADTWAKFIKKAQSLNVYLALFNLILLIILTLPAIILTAYYVEVYLYSIIKTLVALAFPGYTALIKFALRKIARLSNTAFDLHPEVYDARRAVDDYWNMKRLEDPKYFSYKYEPGPIEIDPDIPKYITYGLLVPLIEEGVKRLFAKFWSLSGLRCPPILAGIAYGILESYERYVVGAHDMSFVVRILLHAFLGWLPFTSAVLAHGLWNCLVVYLARDTAALASSYTIFLALITIIFFSLMYTINRIIGTRVAEKVQAPHNPTSMNFVEYYQKPSPASGIQIRPLCIGEIEMQPAPWNKVVKATGCHRRGSPQGYYSVGLNLKCAVPYCFAGCHHNCNAAGLYRMAGLPKRYAQPYGDENDKAKVEDYWMHLTTFMVNLAGIFSAQLMHVGETREITQDEWLKRFTVLQAASIKREYRNGSRSMQFDMFVKKEKSVSYNPKYDDDWAQVTTATDGGYQTLVYPGLIKFHPRGISVPRTDVRAHFGSSSNRLQNYLKLNFSGRILFASGYTRRKFSKWYEHVCTTPGPAFANVGDDLLYIHNQEEGAIIESMDASRFDQHTLACVLMCNARIYRKLGWTEEFRYSMDTISKIYKIRPGFGGAKGKIHVEGTQASGKWDTLGGNSLPMLGIATYCSTFSLDPRKVLFDAGYVCTGPSCGAFELKADFLQNLPYPSSDDGIRFGPKIGRILSRTFWHDHQLTPDKCLPFALGVLVGMANDISHIPILNDLFLRLQELTDRPWFAKKKNIQALVHSDQPAGEHPDCMMLLCDRYQVDRGTLTAYRAYIRNWEPGTFLDEGFEALVYRIVKVDCE